MPTVWHVFLLKRQSCGSHLPVEHVHPWKLTCPKKMDYFSREYIFQPLIFRGHVSFQGSTVLSLTFDDCKKNTTFRQTTSYIQHLRTMLLFLLSLFFLDILLGTLYNRSPQTSSLNDMRFQIMETNGLCSLKSNSELGSLKMDGLGRSDSFQLPFWGKFWPIIFQGGRFALLVSGCVLVTDVDSHLKTRSRQVYKGYTTRPSIGPFFFLQLCSKKLIGNPILTGIFHRTTSESKSFFGRSCRSPFVASQKKEADVFFSSSEGF